MRIIKKLVWSESKPGDASSFGLDYCISEESFWKYEIQWKSWKDYPGYVVMRDSEEYVGCGNDLEAAKVLAQTHYEMLVSKVIEICLEK